MFNTHERKIFGISPRGIGILVVLVLIGGLWVSIGQVQQRQEVRQRAEEPVCEVKQAVCEWDSVSTAASYHVTITDVSSGTTIIATDVSSSVTKFAFSAVAGTSYKCDVYAVSSCGARGSSSNAIALCPLVSPTVTDTPTPTITGVDTPTPTATETPTPTEEITPTETETPTPTLTDTPTPTQTPAPTNTPTPTAFPTPTTRPASGGGPTSTPIPTAVIKGFATATPIPTAVIPTRQQPTQAVIIPTTPTGDAQTTIVITAIGALLSGIGIITFFLL